VRYEGGEAMLLNDFSKNTARSRTESHHRAAKEGLLAQTIAQLTARLDEQGVSNPKGERTTRRSESVRWRT